MDLADIRKKAKQGKDKEDKDKDSTLRQDEKKTEAKPQIDRVLKEEKQRTEAEEMEKPEMVPVQEEKIPPAPIDIVSAPEKTKEEIQRIPSITYAETEEETIIEIVSFKLGDEIYGVKIDRVKEILKPLKITPVPRTPGYLEGVTSLRGEIIPIIDLKKRLGLEGSQEERKKRILILSVRDETMGALIDEVGGVIKLFRDSIEPPPAVIGGIEADFLEGVSRLDDHFIGLLNIEEVMKI